jgi:glutamyl/glutaminyl-tRNA synthetase
MRPQITRFNPTTNGFLHVGHICTALVNQYEARSSGGKFILRFDDNQEIWRMRQSRDSISEVKDSILEDLEWLGICPDLVTSQMEMRGDILRRLTAYQDRSLLASFDLGVTKMIWARNSAELIGTDTTFYPYHAWLTAEKVAADEVQEVSLLIRGVDLITESSLYAYFCDLWRIPQPRQVYLPRLVRPSGGEMSKTEGGFEVREYREKGWTKDEFLSRLALAYLKNPREAFSIENVRSIPVWPYLEGGRS